MQKITGIIELMRLDKPIGIYLLLWPALLTLIIGTQGAFTLLQLAIVIAGSIVVRSAGCVINDIWDRDIDVGVERTKFRPIPSKRVSVKEAWLVFTCLSMMSIFILTLTNINTFMISIGFAILIDLIFGDPKNRYHPTAWIGTLIAKFTTLAKHQNPIFEKIGGVLIIIIISSIVILLLFTLISSGVIAANFIGIVGVGIGDVKNQNNQKLLFLQHRSQS